MSTFDLIEPATGEMLARVPRSSIDDAHVAVEAAHRAFTSGPWRSMNTRNRGRALQRLSQLIRDHGEELSRDEARNVGKPIRDARDEVALAANCFEYYAGTTNKVGGQTIPGAAPGILMTLREPVGVCGIIVPWNFPIAITSWKVAPALAMGNTVVVKPAEQTPLTALRLGELALEAGIPEGVLNVVTGSGSEVGEAIITHPLVRKVAFTGSTEIGVRVMQLAAPDIKRVSLELGGKSAEPHLRRLQTSIAPSLPRFHRRSAMPARTAARAAASSSSKRSTTASAGRWSRRSVPSRSAIRSMMVRRWDRSSPPPTASGCCSTSRPGSQKGRHSLQAERVRKDREHTWSLPFSSTPNRR